MSFERLLKEEEGDENDAGGDENGERSTRSVRLYWALHDPTRSQSATLSSA